MSAFYDDIRFPIKGLDLAAGFAGQREGTTPLGENVRGYEPQSKRLRGGARAGLSKYMDNALPGEIQELNSVVLPSAVALGISFDDVEILDANFQLEDIMVPTFFLADLTVNWIRIGGSGYYTHPSYTRRYGPVINSVTPDGGDWSGGEVITLSGQRMGDTGSDFTFGGMSARVVTNDGTTATVIAPTREEEEEDVTVDVQVDTGVGESAITANTRYTYSGGIAFVQGKSGANTSSGSIQLQFDAAVGAGNLILVFVEAYESVNPPPVYVNVTVADSLGNTYTQVGSYLRPFGSANNQLAVFRAITSAAGTPVITVTSSGTADHDVTMLEYRGVDTTTPVTDSSTNSSLGSTSFSTGSVDTADAGSAHIMYYEHGSSVTATPESGFESAFAWVSSNRRFVVFERTNQDPGTDDFTATASGAVYFLACGLNLKAEA
jgi:hypothetical protein